MNVKKPKTIQKPPAARPQGLLQQLAANPDKLFTDSFRQQYAALCFRYAGKQENLRILVLTSRDSGRWIIPMGGPMKKKKPYQAAETKLGKKPALRVKTEEIQSEDILSEAAG